MSTDILTKVKELEKKADKYEYMKGRYMNYANQLREIKGMIEELIKEIDPVGAIKVRASYRSIKPMIEEFAELIQKGTELKSGLIEKAYSDLNKKQVYQIMNKLRTMPFVAVRKTGRGREIVLYLKSGIPEKSVGDNI